MTRPPAKRPPDPSQKGPSPSSPNPISPPDPGKVGSRGRGSLSRRKKVLFPLLIVVLWGSAFFALEMGLRWGGYGLNTSPFLEIEGGLRIDNPEYTIRFFPAADDADPSRPSNLFMAEKAPSKLRVFVVGGSTAQGFPYERGHSFSQIAKEAFAAQGVEVEIINLGNSALSSYYLREVLQEIDSYDPDLVVIYAGHNEYYGSPSAFTGGTHLTRLAILKLRQLRSFQLFEAAVIRVTGREAAEGQTLMEERFAEFLHPLDEVMDQKIADLFVKNLRSGASPHLRKEIPFLIFEPVSNLISMPPFRSVSDEISAMGEGRISATSLYLDRLIELERDSPWNRKDWEEIKDLDAAPFRARSTLVQVLEEEVTSTPLMRWIPTADKMEARVGRDAFTDDYFIDHLHFTFEGQVLIASILAEEMAITLFPDRQELLEGLRSFFEDTRRVREAVHLTDFWEFRAYSRIVALMEEEPFHSMEIPKALPLNANRIQANPLYADTGLLNMYRSLMPDEDFFRATLEYYALSGNRSELIRNLNAYVYLFSGHFESHLTYGLAVLSDDPQGNIDIAASYLRQAFLLSKRDDRVVDTIRAEFVRLGISSLWPAFEIQYLN